MTIDLSAATDFMATHARVLDRRRFELLNGQTDPSGALAALDGYRNPDGGYGWGLEADLRSPESQPGAALHAFEVFEDIAPATAPQAVALCDWLHSVTLPDGGLPMALPLSLTAGSGPWWQAADPSVSSLQITAASTTSAVPRRPTFSTGSARTSPRTARSASKGEPRTRCSVRSTSPPTPTGLPGPSLPTRSSPPTWIALPASNRTTVDGSSTT